ncbi:MAG: YdeI/OmpD-associated family protein [Pseudomonadota bacterium]
MVKPAQEAAQVEVTSRAELREWLSVNHTLRDGVWLVSHKKVSPHYLLYDDLVEECLCFGWVDSLPRALDEMRSMHYIAPRKPSSAWSKVNKARVTSLIEQGLMAPPGLALIEQAKEDGTWSFLDDFHDGIAPPDLREALSKYPNAQRHFDGFPTSSKKIILEWIKTAKRPETRTKLIQDTAEKAERNERANHYRQNDSGKAGSA